MTLGTPTTLDTTTDDTSSATVTSGSISPTPNALLVAVCLNFTSGSASITGFSDTFAGTGSWTIHENSKSTASGELSVAIATAQLGSSPGSGTVTGTVSPATARRALWVFEITGHDVSAPVKNTKAGTSTSSTPSLTLDSSPDSDSCVVGAVGDAGSTSSSNVSPGTNYTELGSDLTYHTGGSGGWFNLELEYDSTPTSTTVDWSGVGTTTNSFVAIEIDAAATGTNTSDSQPAYIAGSQAASDSQPAYISGASVNAIDIQGNEGHISYVATSGDAVRAILNAVSTQDVETTLTFRFSNNTVGMGLRIFIRASRDWNSIDTPTSGYEVLIEPDGDYTLNHIASGSRNLLGSGTWTGDTADHDIRFQAVGTAVKFKIWASAGAEPGTWSNEHTAGASEPAGTLQLAASYISGSSSYDIYFDDLSYHVPAGAGTPVSDNQAAYLAGTATASDNQSAYLAGSLDASDNQSSYLIGSIDTSDSQSAYLIGSVDTSSSTSAYLIGSVDTISSQAAYTAGVDTASDNQVAYTAGVDTASDNQVAYTAGVDTASDNQPAYLLGSLGATDNQAAYTAGVDTETDSQPAFLVGSLDASDNQAAYTVGGIVESDSQAAYLEGTAVGAIDNKSAYLAGIDTTSDNQSAFLAGSLDTEDSKSAYTVGSIDTSTSQSAFTAGSLDVTDSQPAFLQAEASSASSQAAYTIGSVNTSDNQAAYTQGQDTASDSKSAYLEGSINVTDSQSAYLAGVDTTSSSQSAYMAVTTFFPFEEDFSTGTDGDSWRISHWVTGTG